MNTIKPALPQPKNLRWAAALNLFLPGAGLFYLGHRKTGTGLALGFLLCLMAALGIFVAGYIHYLSVISSDLMQEGQIEQLKDVFHKGWLVGLAVAGVSLQVVSMIALARVRPSQREGAPREPIRPEGG